MDRKQIQRYINVATGAIALVIAIALVWEVLFPGSRLAKIIGVVAFGVLCCFVRAVPPKFFIPKLKK
nr:hypothetical protein [uncultured Duganella sp.]